MSNATNRDGRPLIMVVDDTPANLTVLAEMLYKRRYKVVQFPDGAAAIDAATRRQPDLILLDIMMPGLDGFDICRKLKANEVLEEIPVIFISALDDAESKIRAFTEGGVDYVTKPFREEEVLARIETHLELRRMQSRMKQQNEHLDQLVRQKVAEIEESQLATILALSYIAEDRDDDTGMHIERTRTFCTLLARNMQNSSVVVIDDDFLIRLYYAAPLHDIGKVSIPDEILLKPGKLTDDEFEQMKTHTLKGSSTLERVHARYPGNGFVSLGIELTRSHHEKWDGTGYPDGLVGEEIPLCGRIMALADVYDALRSRRPYKEPFSHERSCEIIIGGRGQHFDPAVVDAFIQENVRFAEYFERLLSGSDNVSSLQQLLV